MYPCCVPLAIERYQPFLPKVAARLVGQFIEADWQKLSAIINEKEVRPVSLDSLTSHQFLTQRSASGDSLASRMLGAGNGLFLDTLAPVAWKDYEACLRRQRDGTEKAQE